MELKYMEKYLALPLEFVGYFNALRSMYTVNKHISYLHSHNHLVSLKLKCSKNPM